MVRKYATLYVFVVILLVVIIAAPAVVGSMKSLTFYTKLYDGSTSLPSFADGLFQPRNQNHNDTGKGSGKWTHSWTTKTSLSTWSTKA
ncbi:unnamed protein product [Ambrosiozyma monospora]|uniref:Unnamed protein product n=1 Tax=Ambrosiozyma monospora TaxID=43982 RepID=A0ACB5U1N0_AMBMO|nr:unnamed protein product [Ambrosiozyma monospora]